MFDAGDDALPARRVSCGQEQDRDCVHALFSSVRNEKSSGRLPCLRRCRRPQHLPVVAEQLLVHVCRRDALDGRWGVGGVGGRVAPAAVFLQLVPARFALRAHGHGKVFVQLQRRSGFGLAMWPRPRRAAVHVSRRVCRHCCRAPPSSCLVASRYSHAMAKGQAFKNQAWWPVSAQRCRACRSYNCVRT